MGWEEVLRKEGMVEMSRRMQEQRREEEEEEEERGRKGVVYNK